MMRSAIQRGRFARLLSCAVLAAPFAIGQSQSSVDDVHFFEKKVRPVLVNRCYACHSAATKPAGGLRVDDRNGLLNGGDSGPAVVPGDPDGSLLLARIRHENPKRRMPKEGDGVTNAELEDIITWIRNGVAWPAEQIPASLGRTKANYEALKARHWAFQPLKRVPAPAVIAHAWPRTDIDRFILAKLEQQKLAPVGDAARTNFVRRVTFDLTGLPPTPAEIGAFVNDRSAGAYKRLVDRLLESPRFGERWGRHWLDVARYGESTGPSRNVPYPHAWRYRDYVIDAVNRDVPFDRFLQEQIAGDLLPANSDAERDRLRIATGFLALGPKDVNQRFKGRFLMDNVDEKIDTISRSALARGWDHHTNLHNGLIERSRQVDQPTSALLTDLKQRGLLEDTLVLFGSEFGRLPMAQGFDGRDHNITGYSMFLTGAGVKKGFSYGATDELGVQAVEGRMHTNDLHATLLALMGLHHKQLTHRYAGRDFRLTDVAGEIHREIFA